MWANLLKKTLSCQVTIFPPGLWQTWVPPEIRPMGFVAKILGTYSSFHACNQPIKLPKKTNLGGGFKYFLFSPQLGEMIKFH